MGIEEATLVEKLMQARRAGRQEIVEWIKWHPLIAPKQDSTTRFEPFYQIEQSELKKWRL